MRLGVIIDAACYYRGVTTAQLAAKLAVSEETVRRWRRGETKLRMDQAQELVSVLRLPGDLLLRPPATRERALALIAAYDALGGEA